MISTSLWRSGYDNVTIHQVIANIVVQFHLANPQIQLEQASHRAHSYDIFLPCRTISTLTLIIEPSSQKTSVNAATHLIPKFTSRPKPTTPTQPTHHHELQNIRRHRRSQLLRLQQKRCNTDLQRLLQSTRWLRRTGLHDMVLRARLPDEGLEQTQALLQSGSGSEVIVSSGSDNTTCLLSIPGDVLQP